MLNIRIQVLLAALVLLIGTAGDGAVLADGDPTNPAGSEPPPAASPTPIPPVPSGVVRYSNSGLQISEVSPAPQAPAFGDNVRMNQDVTAFPQNETSIAINPTDLDNIVAGANDYRIGSPRSGFYSSADGGSTWTDGLLPNYPAGVHSSGDPAVAFDASGNAYYASLGFPDSGEECQSTGGVYVSRSSDGGLSWAAPLQVASNSPAPAPFLFADKEYIAVDRSGGAFDGQIYVSLTIFEFDTGCLDGYVSSPIFVATLAPSGATVSNFVQIGGGAADLFSQGSVPGVDSSGNVHVGYQTFDPSCPETVSQLAGADPVPQRNGIHVARSTDGGISFGTPTLVACQFSLPYSLGQAEYVLPPTVFRVNSFPSLAINPVNDHIYVVWAEWVPQTDADIHFVRSTDGGLTWSAPVRVNDDAVANGRDQFFPWVSASPDGTRIDVVFYDRRDDPANTDFHTYLSSSFDGGSTFSANRRVTPVASDPANDGFTGQFIGDYNGIASTNDALHPVWTDTRSGNADVFYAPLAALPTVAVQAAVSVNEGDVGTTKTIEALVTLSHVLGLPISVQYDTSDGTATAADSDYDAVSGGVLTIPAGSATGTIRIIINGNDTYEADETFSVTLSNATTTSTTTPLAITATTTVATIANDDAPTALVDTVGIDEGGALAIAAPGVLGNDSAPIASLTGAVFSTPSFGAFSPQSDGSFTYAHDGGETLTDSFTYVARFTGSTGTIDSNVATVTITITPLNDSPEANEDSYIGFSQQTIAVPAPGVMTNDKDADDVDPGEDPADHVLTASLVAGSFVPQGSPVQSSLTLSGDGSFTYEPGDFLGTQTFRYTATDDSAAVSGEAVVTITIPGLTEWGLGATAVLFALVITAARRKPLGPTRRS